MRLPSLLRFPLLVLFSATLWLGVAPIVRAQSSDPDQVFLSAYMSAQQAEKLESEQSYKAALAKFRFAGSILDQLQQRHPEWNPPVVTFRKKKVTEAIQRMEEKIALEAPPAPQPGLDPNLLPGINDPLPTRSGSSTGDHGGGDAFDRAAREMRAQMSAVKQELEASRKQLDAVQQEKERLARQLADASRQLSNAANLSQEQADKIRKAEAAKVEAAKAEAAKAREQEGALREQLAKSQESEAALKAQIKQVHSEETDAQKKIDRNSTAVQALQAQLEEAKAEAEKVKAQLSKAKTTESDLQAKLEETRKRLENQAKESDQATAAQTAEIKKEMEKLRTALEDAKADREVAQEQDELIFKKSAQLAKERTAAVSRNEQLSKELAAAQTKAAALAETEAKLTKVTKERDTAQESLAEAEKKLVAMAKERETDKAKTAEMATQLASTKKTVETLTSERDNALAQLAKAQEARGQVDKLLAENASLMKKLDDAQKTIAEFSSAAPEKDKQITALKTQLSGVQDQLDAAKKEGISNRVIIGELQKQLDDAKTAKAPPATDEEKRVSQENELLRGIVLRELKDQARREQARKLVMSELDRLQVRSKSLTEQIGLLSQPATKLTDAERALFKGPQMEIIDNTPGAMSISIAAPASGSQEPAAKPTPWPVPGDSELPSNAAPASSSDSRSLDSAPKVATETRPAVPADLQQLAKEAKDKFNRGDYLEAERAYEKIVSKAPTNIYALSNLGVARFRAGHLKLAEETFKKVIALAPSDAFAHSTLGIVYFQQSKYDEAITSLTQAVAVNPKNATSHNFLGIAAAKKGWTEAAQKELETALQLDPNYADAHYNIAVLLATSQPPNKEGARKHYKKALELGMKADATFEETLR